MRLVPSLPLRLPSLPSWLSSPFGREWLRGSERDIHSCTGVDRECVPSLGAPRCLCREPDLGCPRKQDPPEGFSEGSRLVLLAVDLAVQKREDLDR